MCPCRSTTSATEPAVVTRARLGLAVALIGCLGAAQAASVAMTGGMGSKALLVINGGAPKALAAGDTHQGVKVVSVANDRVTIEVNGRRDTVMLGGAPVSVGAGAVAGGGREIVLHASSGGHFVTQGSINGRSTRFMVDTGATTIAMGADEARRLGIQFESGEPFYGSTANGTVRGYRVQLRSVRIQEVEVFGVEAAVLPQPMPYILLGNSFLSRFQMKRENEQLTLSRRF
ncbi:TIGR02281 family clan AA aspartic protease [Aquabacterium fontiphilum]|nr:TIGR02281 family clan AA aspartic protease [Aquabacterium fontiphilum]